MTKAQRLERYKIMSDTYKSFMKKKYKRSAACYEIAKKSGYEPEYVDYLINKEKYARSKKR